MIIAAIVIGMLLASVLILGTLIYSKQKKLDAPYGGILVVEKNDGEPANVYFRAVADPGELQDQQDLKLKVRVINSQG